MIDTITIDNFQSHKHTELKLCDGVNVLVGKSTTGKTAVLRALQWLSTNRPLGVRLKSNFSSKKEPVKVTITTTDGHTISLKKTSYGESTYTLDKQEFKGFGSDVPDVIRKVLNLSSLNIQEQLDKHFLICSSPGEVARTINQVMKVEEVDKWISELTSEVNASTKLVAKLEKNLRDTEQDIKKYDNLPKLIKMVDSLVKKEEKLSSYKEKYSELTKQLERIEDIHLKVNQLKVVVLRTSDIHNLEELNKQAEKLVNSKEVLEKAIQLSYSIGELREELSVLDFIVLKYEHIHQLRKEYLKENEKYATLGMLVDMVHSGEEKYKELNQEYSKLGKQFVHLLRDTSKCPTCYSDLTEDKIGVIIDEVNSTFGSALSLG